MLEPTAWGDEAKILVCTSIAQAVCARLCRLRQIQRSFECRDLDFSKEASRLGIGGERGAPALVWERGEPTLKASRAPERSSHVSARDCQRLKRVRAFAQYTRPLCRVH
jgi:hypothetical protein